MDRDYTFSEILKQFFFGAPIIYICLVEVDKNNQALTLYILASLTLIAVINLVAQSTVSVGGWGYTLVDKKGVMHFNIAMQL